MQTSKWGPSGWVYLHTIAHNYNPEIHNKDVYREFFRIQGDVLPCKYCRASYQHFFKELPIDDYLGCQRDLAYWMYLMHNKVNDKLRRQGLLKKKDPSFKSVYAKYEQFKADCASKRGKPDTCRMPYMKDRCTYVTKKGRQCSRKQTRKGCCTQHQKSLGSRKKSRSRRKSRGSRRKSRRR